MIKITEEFSENKSRKSKDKNTKGLKNTKRKNIKLEQLVILPAVSYKKCNINGFKRWKIGI